MNCAERRKGEEIRETHCGGMSKQKKRLIKKKKKHLIRDARIAHRKIRTIIGKRETKQRKWSQKP